MAPLLSNQCRLERASASRLACPYFFVRSDSIDCKCCSRWFESSTQGWTLHPIKVRGEPSSIRRDLTSQGHQWLQS